MSDTQRRVRETIATVGGYWRPLAGLARLLEEMGELADSLLADARDDAIASELADSLLADAREDAIASELADLWIISTALADQFLAAVEEPGSGGPGSGGPGSGGPGKGEPRERPARGALAGLIAAAGPVARVVNYYDGPKIPRRAESLPSLAAAVAAFHNALDLLAGDLRFDLAAAVNAKLDEIAQRDVGRFAGDVHDPSSAPVLARFRAIGAASAGLRPDARLWGAPEWRQDSLAEGAAAMARDLVSFTRAASRERLDAYVIPGPEPDPADGTRRWMSELLAAIARQDPAPTARGGAESGGEDDPLGWIFNGTPLIAIAIAPIDLESDTPHGASGAFLAVRPSQGERPASCAGADPHTPTGRQRTASHMV